jgi:hypothetical protein
MSTGPGVPVGYHGSADVTDTSTTYRLDRSHRIT